MTTAGYQKKADANLISMATSSEYASWKWANRIWYGKDVPIPDVKAIATSLVRGKVPIRMITEFKETTPINERMLVIGGSLPHVSGNILTPDDIASGKWASQQR